VKLTFIILTMLDALLTAVAVHMYGPLVMEVNPIALAIVTSFGPFGLVAVKVFSLMVVLWIMRRCERTRPTWAPRIYFYGCVVSGIGALSGVVTHACMCGGV
jgi:uncharacterized membrane protein